MEDRQQSALSWSLRMLRRVGSEADLSVTVSAIRDHYKFSHLAFLVVRRATPRDTYPFYCTTYPEEWTSVYLDRNYFEIDPVIDLSRTGFLPVDWSNIDRRSPRARSFFKEAVSFDIGRQGLTIPVRGPGGERSLFSATSNLPRSEWRTLLTSTSRDLQVLSHFLHEKAFSVSGLRKHGEYRKLSRREQECLQLLAGGIVSKRIAATLQISESAVRLYLKLAKRKLGTATIYQAVARASYLEIIQV
ncbi:LuxR family transcriptional regulator (plasmid) [Rhizobium sp. K1/93]|nr:MULTISPECIES: LuxR family transcriptional regulator [unclassified Rhizobium]QXZ88349.1 LuxR family transcriptional regulator [Rhizobium sp. K1/93]QXZ94400.1 LuxR family transcriptional regulator [Rhizobium sp. K15/93]QYA05819.1 LuxR family transcriptional regulator [Rhizobium sp. B21/90]MBO9101902.1 LuxR family transcriptional regulator [Rhizobium sp. L58/93]MBO9172073.1 LuxR family transcriptional regulator [Rhizobium sp. L245/93]